MEVRWSTTCLLACQLLAVLLPCSGQFVLPSYDASTAELSYLQLRAQLEGKLAAGGGAGIAPFHPPYFCAVVAPDSTLECWNANGAGSAIAALATRSLPDSVAELYLLATSNRLQFQQIQLDDDFQCGLLLNGSIVCHNNW